MTPLVLFGAILLCLAIFLIVAILFFSLLKYIKKQYYPNWKFPDYISVGYAEYLYHKFIKRDLKK
ncbi:hypothetical protein [Mucilaginibacter dorajii]|jgi:hypothetical protein|uniref:Uncharacterized protein n=1 Tax=Mucilaginibacter dorajii TaxID=692994 RepID=A0ABP7NZK8_9SPHI|nr:hypothetical protein [Mucilaginibacter dorajii]MCS3737947.1 hypothetical protein [Mucilaginibacter dorajii]